MFSSVAFLLLIATANADVHNGGWGRTLRTRRSSDHIIKDCMTVTSETGHYFFKSGRDDRTVCGVYLSAPPDRIIEVYFDYLDDVCNADGLVAFFDGWELNGGYFPTEEEGARPMADRFDEFCRLKRPKKLYISSQNAALIQYRIPKKGRGFSFKVQFLKNPSPCNILVDGNEEVFTLRNYGKPSNCSLTAVFPVRMSVLSLGVGISLPNTNFQIETGTIHKCQEKGLSDYLQIGGGDDLGLSRMTVLDNLCGVDSIPGRVSDIIMCGVSTVRLVSSGEYDNSATLTFRPATEDDVSTATFICPI